MKLNGLRTAQFRPVEMDMARDWYTELFGTEPYFDSAGYVGYELAGYEFGLFADASGRDAPLFLWAVDDPSSYIDHAIQLGASIGMRPTDTGDGIVVGSFVDPFGNEFGLIRNPHFAPHPVEVKADDLSDRVITRRAEVPVVPDAAWDLWASSQGIAKWWTEHTRVEMRPGGYYEIYFMPDEPAGDRGGDWCRVLSFLPGRMLSFTWNAPPHLNTRPLHTWVVLTFERSEIGTRVELSHLGWPESGLSDLASDWPATFEYFEGAWTSVMDLFEKYFGES